MNNQMTFDWRVAVEAILYLANKSKTPTFHHVFKLLYLADRCHLARYGRLIYGDRYIAMKHGPVPSSTYDILKSLRGESFFAVSDSIASSLAVWNEYHIRALRSANLEWLSDSDIECLEESLQRHDDMTFNQLTRLTHDSAWNSADLDDEISFDSLVRSVDQKESLGGLLVSHLQNPIP